MQSFCLFFFLVTCTFNNTIAQDKPGIRYLDQIFEIVTIKKNIPYLNEIPKNSKLKYYQLDLYEAASDSNRSKPLIIWIHGGGFKFGTKHTRGTRIWSRTFAQRGYICAAINYRLSKKKPLSRIADMADGCLEAVQDLALAVRFLKQHASQYHIDSNRIILAGNSAGGIAAIQAVYGNTSELARMAGRADITDMDNRKNPMGIAAVLSFWGAIFDSSWMAASTIPIVCIHGSRDRVIPAEGKGPLWGSAIIHRQADAAGIPNQLKLFSNCGHELQKHFNPITYSNGARKRWLIAGQFAASFLYNQCFKKTTGL